MGYDKEENENMETSDEIGIETYRLPNKITKANFTLVPNHATKATVMFKNLDVPNKERVSYQVWDGSKENGYKQLANGLVNGSIIYDNIDRNTKRDLQIGLVAANTSGPFVIPSVPITVYPVFSEFTNAKTLKATRDSNNVGSINISWSAWGNWGNLPTWSAQAQVIDLTNNMIVTRKVINVKNAGSTTIADNSASDNVRVRIVATGSYHDGKAKTVLSNQVSFISDNNTYVKVNGTWRKGLKTFVKVSGVWQAHKGNVRTKVNGVWK